MLGDPDSRDLYSPDLDRRYRATLLAGSRAERQKWPVGCGGAANAFLVLLGPSPGGAGAGQTPERGGANRPYRDAMRLGRDVMNFDWGDHRKARWTRLCAEMLGGEQYVRTLSALLNLDWRHSTQAKEIPDADLENGLEHIWPLLQLVRPRILAPLTNRVWKTMLPKVEGCVESFPPCPVELAREPVVFRLPRTDFLTMLVKPHHHPSRFLSNAEIIEVGRACAWFLSRSASKE